MILLPTYKFKKSTNKNNINCAYNDSVFSCVDNIYDKHAPFKLKLRVKYISAKFLTSSNLFKKMIK